MKTQILDSGYTFDHSAGTITFTGYTTIYLDQILSVFNVTRGVMMFNVGGGSGLTGTVATNVLTLAISTGSMADADKLLIYYSDPSVAQKVDGSGVTQPVSISSGTVTSTPPEDTTPATQNIAAVDSASTSTTEQSGQVAITGVPSANSAASFAISSLESVLLQLSGTWVGTLLTEVSFDGGATWYSRGIHQQGISYITSSFTSNGAGSMNVAGMTHVRVRASLWTSGTATVRLVGSTNPSTVYVANPVHISDPTTPSQQLAIDSSGHATVNINGAPSVTANAGTNLNTSALALETGGNLATTATNTGNSASALGTTTGAKVITDAAGTIQQYLRGIVYQLINTLTVTIAAGTNLIGDIGNRASASGGWSSYFANALKGTVQTISSATGKFAGAALINIDSAPVFLQIFDTIGSVTLGTTTPTMVIPYPCNATATNGASDRLMDSVGASISNGIKVAATTTATGSTASTNGLTGTIWYK